MIADASEAQSQADVSAKDRAEQLYEAANRFASLGDPTRALELVDEALELRDQLRTGLVFTLEIARAQYLRAVERYPTALEAVERILAMPVAEYQHQFHAQALLIRALVYHHWGLTDQMHVAYENAKSAAARIDEVITKTAQEIEAIGADTKLTPQEMEAKRTERQHRYRYLVEERALLETKLRYTQAVELLAREKYAETIGRCSEAIAILERMTNRSDAIKRSQFELISTLASLELERTGTRDFSPIRDRFERLALDTELGGVDRERCRLRVVQIDIMMGDASRVAEFFALPAPDESHLPPSFRCERARLFARYALEFDASESTIRRADELVVAAYRRFAEQWRATPLREGGLGILEYYPLRALISESIRVSQALGRTKEGSLALWLDACSLDSLSRKIGAGAPTLDAIRRHLLQGATDRGILAFLPAADRTHLIVVATEEVEILTLRSYDEIIPKCRQVSDEILRVGSSRGADDERLPDSLVDKLVELGRELFPPELDAVSSRWRGISIVGAELLDRCPFELLPFRDRGLVGCALAVDFPPSLAFAVAIASAPIRAGLNDVRLIAAPAPIDPDSDELTAIDGSSYPVLEISREHAERILSHYANPTRLEFGAEAGWPTGPTDELASTLVLEILTHGGFDPLDPRAARLLLRERDGTGLGWLDATRVDRSFSGTVGSPPIVILAACGSGQHAARRGDPQSSSLAGAWLANGSRVVVVSQHDLDLRTAVEFSEQVHAEFARNRSPAEAVRLARAEASQPEWSTRLLDRAFIRVIGLGHQTIGGTLRARPTGSALLWSLPLILLAAFFVWTRMRSSGRAAS